MARMPDYIRDTFRAYREEAGPTTDETLTADLLGSLLIAKDVPYHEAVTLPRRRTRRVSLRFNLHYSDLEDF